MKFQVTLAAAFLPLVALAVPTAEAQPAEPVPAEQVPRSLDEVSKRSSIGCKIVNSSSDKVNCRSGPGTSYPVVAYVFPGTTYTFNCYKSGDCYEGNCTWDRVNYSGGVCYVNGYYTSSACSTAALGKC
ncbi:hypothetical protein N7467_012323 [Penicillium canescens]|nr:hypothetical protein N7467_012323 [Penicillium canescens]